jgi:acyl dehydratase
VPIQGYSLATLPAFLGNELGITGWLTVEQSRIDQFAACTDDHQWIHTDVERARRESPVGSTIMHGYLTLSLLARFVFEVGMVPEGVSQALNYGLERVRFLAPVKAGASIRDRVVLLAAEDKGKGRTLLRAQHTIEIQGESKPAMIAEVLTLLVAS